MNLANPKHFLLQGTYILFLDITLDSAFNYIFCVEISLVIACYKL